MLLELLYTHTEYNETTSIYKHTQPITQKRIFPSSIIPSFYFHYFINTIIPKLQQPSQLSPACFRVTHTHYNFNSDLVFQLTFSMFLPNSKEPIQLVFKDQKPRSFPIMFVKESIFNGQMVKMPIPVSTSYINNKLNISSHHPTTNVIN